MTEIYKIRNATELSPSEIEIILEYWQVEEWKKMNTSEFKKKFTQSEFHFLTDEASNILALARINFDFKIQIQNELYAIAELVGLVAVVKMKGYGKKLIKNIQSSWKERNIEAIGFCEKQLRSFYEKCAITIMVDKAKQLRERESNQWIIPTDDDILDVSLSRNSLSLLKDLSSTNIGYLIFS